MTSGRAPTANAATGMPRAMASSAAMGRPSWRDGMHSSPISPQCGPMSWTMPRQSTAAAAIAARSGPSPNTMQRRPGSPAARAANRSGPFSCDSRPTKPTASAGAWIAGGTATKLASVNGRPGSRRAMLGLTAIAGPRGEVSRSRVR